MFFFIELIKSFEIIFLQFLVKYIYIVVLVDSATKNLFLEIAVFAYICSCIDSP